VRSASPVNSAAPRPYFAAVEAEIAQRVVIELPKCIVEIPRLPTSPMARVRSACDCTGCLDYRDDDLAEGERAMGASEFAQRAVVELVKYAVEIPRLPTLPVARVRPACDCTGCLDHPDDDRAEGERAMGARGLMQLVTRRPRGRCRIGGRDIAKAVCRKRVLCPRLGAIVGDRRILTGGIVAGVPAS
jgi:hypothetical protein